MIMYLVGLLVGVVLYALTCFLTKEWDYKRRATTISIVGLLFMILSFAIGGFNGMPIAISAIGILTISLITTLFGKSQLWRKGIFIVIVLLIAGAFAFSTINKIDYWVIKKTNEYATDNEIYEYVDKVQTDSDIKGYKTFDTVDSKTIVLSLGNEMAGNNIEVMDIEEVNGKTVINVKSFYNKSIEENPTIIIGLDRLKPTIEIQDTDGTVYKETKEYK